MCRRAGESHVDPTGFALAGEHSPDLIAEPREVTRCQRPGRPERPKRREGPDDVPIDGDGDRPCAITEAAADRGALRLRGADNENSDQDEKRHDRGRREQEQQPTQWQPSEESCQGPHRRHVQSIRDEIVLLSRPPGRPQFVWEASAVPVEASSAPGESKETVARGNRRHRRRGGAAGDKPPPYEAPTRRKAASSAPRPSMTASA